MTDIALGLVGYGKIARDQHLPALAALPGIRVVAVADPVTRHDTLPSYADLAAMLVAHPEIDAVTLCQPPQYRFEGAREAIVGGRHVFLEKPPGATISEAESLVAMARRAGVTLFTAWHSREAAGVAAAKAWLHGKALRSVRIDWKEDVRVWHPGQHWISQPGGFGVFDPGVNALSILTEIMPEPVRVLSARLDYPENWLAPVAAHLHMATLGGVPIRAEFDFRQTGPQSWYIAIETEKASLLLSDGGNTLTIDGIRQAGTREQEYPALYRRFADLVQRGQSDTDLAPLRLVADAFLLGQTTATGSLTY